MYTLFACKNIFENNTALCLTWFWNGTEYIKEFIRTTTDAVTPLRPKYSGITLLCDTGCEWSQHFDVVTVSMEQTAEINAPVKERGGVNFRQGFLE